MEIACKYCGRIFKAKPSAVKKGKKYCSKKCYDRAQFKGEIKNCTTCGKEIKVPPSLIRANNFCSNECRLVWLSKHVTQEINIPGHKAPYLTRLNKKRNLQQEIHCETCGKIFYRDPSRVSRHNFCCKECAKIYTSQRMAEYNKTENPMNAPNSQAHYKKSKDEMHEIRVRAALKTNGGCYKQSTYKKLGNRHEHRIVAEQILGRSLKPGEVVHHINGNRRDNKLENLMMFSSQQEHVAYHAAHPEESGVQLGKRGDVR